jgi:hypothetical protein
MNIDMVTIHKMFFIYNALNNGWTIDKKDDYYVFKKKHNNNKEIYEEDFLNNFIRENIISQ